GGLAGAGPEGGPATPCCARPGARRGRFTVWREGRPAAVRSRAGLRRPDGGTPRCGSSDWICRLTAEGERLRSAAASLKLNVSAAREKARRKAIGGSSSLIDG